MEYEDSPCTPLWDDLYLRCCGDRHLLGQSAFPIITTDEIWIWSSRGVTEGESKNTTCWCRTPSSKQRSALNAMVIQPGQPEGGTQRNFLKPLLQTVSTHPKVTPLGPTKKKKKNTTEKKKKAENSASKPSTTIVCFSNCSAQHQCNGLRRCSGDDDLTLSVLRCS